MKNTISASCILIFSLSTLSAQFSPPFFLNTLTNQTIRQIHGTDFNADGLADILTSNLHWPKDIIKLYLNEGNAVFTKTALPGVDSIRAIEYIDVGDINRDGRMDFIVAGEIPYRLTWYENHDNGFTPHIVEDSLDFTTQVLLRDFDGNGWLDILSLQHTEIVLYLDQQDGTFGVPIIIHSGTEFYAIDAGYYDADTILDAAVASAGFEILLHDGQGGFTIESQQGIHLVFGLKSADLDGDLDMDIAAYNVLNGIVFYTNDAAGHFTLQDTLLHSLDIYEQYVLTDLDCDDDIDLYTTVPQRGWVVWVENRGNEGFDSLQILYIQFDELVDAMAVADLDGDISPDLIWGNKRLGAMLNECKTVSAPTAGQDRFPIEIYPNPTDHIFYLSNAQATEARYELFDAVGKWIEQGKVNGNENKAVPLPYPGLYFILLKNESGESLGSKRIIRN